MSSRKQEFLEAYWAREIEYRKERVPKQAQRGRETFREQMDGFKYIPNDLRERIVVLVHNLINEWEIEKLETMDFEAQIIEEHGLIHGE
jgi:hypothetical protein